VNPKNEFLNEVLEGMNAKDTCQILRCFLKPDPDIQDCLDFALLSVGNNASSAEFNEAFTNECIKRI
jgi:hypothetical protein